MKRTATIIQRNKHQLDAANKIAGRLASQAAVLLMGKPKTGYRPNLDIGDYVEVANVAKLKFSGKKISQKIYYRTSGYPGGITATPLKKIFAEQPAKLFKMMVRRMLPKNKLRAARLKRLIFTK